MEVNRVEQILAPLKGVELRATEYAEIVKFLLARVRIFDGPEDRLAFFELNDALKKYLRRN